MGILIIPSGAFGWIVDKPARFIIWLFFEFPSDNVCQTKKKQIVRRWHCLGGPVVRLANQDELEEVGINILIHNFIVISMR